MKVTETPLMGCYVIEPTVLGDARGYFFESFSKKKFFDLTGISFDICQENQSRSNKGVLRGMHFQIGEFAQSKIVRVLEGEVLDVVVDLRKGSPSYGQHHSETLTALNKKQIYVPKGFAHGFLIISEQAEFFYGIDRPYSPEHEKGIRYDDPQFGMKWGDLNDIILSQRDQEWPLFTQNQNYFD